MNLDFILRLMNGDENEEVDFKKEPNSDLPGDIVSFANSSSGGYLLIGTEEYKDANGAQKGKLTENGGLELTDENKQKIINRLRECQEGLIDEVTVIPVEFSGNHGVYVTKIPSGKNKPYCTSRGTYYIRVNGGKTPLLPSMMRRLLSNKPDTDKLSKDIEQHIQDFLALNNRPWDDTAHQESRDLQARMKGSLLHPIFNNSGLLQKFEREGFGGFGSAYNETKEIFPYRGKTYTKRFTWSSWILEILDDAKTYLSNASR